MTVTIYGIKNCDTMKKARAWLADHAIEAEFHDYKTSGIDEPQLRRWCDAAGWETVLNRSGTTFRKLHESEKQHLDTDKAIAEGRSGAVDRLLIGFKPELYEQFFD